MAVVNMPGDPSPPKTRFGRAWRWTTRRWWRPLLLAFVAIGLGVLVSRQQDEDGHLWWPWILVLVASAVCGVASILAGAECYESWDFRRNPDSRQRRMQELVEALNKATTTISLIRDEVDEGRRLLADLESRATTQQELARINDPQVQAVADQLRTELRLESKRGLIRDVVLGTLFFGAGVVATILLG